MTRSILTGALLAALAATGVSAQEELGRREYMVACAVCHGESGLGDGPMAELLAVETPNLRQMAARSGGAFPFNYAIWMIDGRELIRMHGNADMPVWGDRFLATAELSEAASETPESRELVARGRILSLVYYLASIQE